MEKWKDLGFPLEEPGVGDSEETEVQTGAEPEAGQEAQTQPEVDQAEQESHPQEQESKPEKKRFSPDRAFPDAAFLPGTGMPRPEEAVHPEGPWSVDNWTELEPWLYGVDLYNAEYFWEAHEAWEAVWKSWSKDSAEGLLVRGCIQTSAALLKLRLENQGGVKKLSRRSMETLEKSLETMDGETLLGLNLSALLEALKLFWKPLEQDEMPNLSDFPRIDLTLP